MGQIPRSTERLSSVKILYAQFVTSYYKNMMMMTTMMMINRCCDSSVCPSVCLFFLNCGRLSYALKQQVAQLSQRDRAAGWVSYGQKWKTGTGRQYLQTI